MSLTNNIEQNDFLKKYHITNAIEQASDYVNQFREGNLNYIATGWPKFNKHLGLGIEEGWTITLGARPGMGKSAIALQLIQDAFEININKKIVVVFFNWEMTGKQQAMRMFSQVKQHTLSDIKSSDKVKLTDINKGFKELAGKYKSLPFYIIDNPQSPSAIKNYFKKFKELHKDHFILNVFDHTRLVLSDAGANKSEEKKIFEFYATCNIIKKLGATNLILSQLNRKVEDDIDITENKYRSPIGSDLFGADAVEQFSDLVLFPHRPDRYGFKTIGPKNNQINVVNKIFLDIWKYRDGENNKRLVFNNNLKYSKIEEL